MTWNYRAQLLDNGWYRIVEAHYKSNGTVALWSERGAVPGGETLDELRSDLGLMLAALGRPVIDRDGNEVSA